jgi:hypothetical protein
MDNKDEEKYYINANNKDVKKLINKLNDELKEKCDKCELKITQENDQDIQNITHYGEMIKTNNPVLCFNYKNECISSLIISRKGDIIEYLAETHSNFERRKINQLLISVLFIIANKIDKNIKRVLITIANVASAYILIKNFDATIWGDYDLDDYKKYYRLRDSNVEIEYEYNDTRFRPFPAFKDKEKTYSNINKKIDEYSEFKSGEYLYCIAEINSETQQKGEDLFDEIIENLKISGGKKTRKNHKRKSNKSKRKYNKK